MEQYLEAWGCPRLIKIACLGDELKSIIKDLEKKSQWHWSKDSGLTEVSWEGKEIMTTGVP